MEVYEGKEPYIFISYAHLNGEIIIPVIREIYNLGFRVWYDKGIYGGDEWREVVAGHVQAAKFVVAFISEEFSNSRNCRDEIYLARERNIIIIPVYVDASENPSYLTPGNQMILLSYNAVLAEKLFILKNNKEIAKEICDSPEMQLCRHCNKEAEISEGESATSLSFSREFLHSGARAVEKLTAGETKKEINRLSGLFNSIFYLKHNEEMIPAENIAETVMGIIRKGIDGDRKNLLKIKGPLGSYKNRLLQYIYLYLEKEDNCILPFYVDLSMYEKAIEKGKINEKSDLEQLVQMHFKQIKNIICENPGQKPVIIIDGVRDFSSGHDRIYYITKNCLSELNCKIIVCLDTDFTKNHKFAVHPLMGSDFEYFIRISSMDIFNKEACIKFIGSCLDTFNISTDSYNVDENIIYERLNQLGIIKLDAYWISNLMREMLINILNPELTAADIYEAICMKELDGGQIKSAAQLAYDYEYGTADFSNSEFYFDARWKIMRKHRSVLDYLIARYYVLKFDELDLDNTDDVEQQFRFFSMILPKSVTVFVTPMINKLDAFESKVLEYANRYYELLSVPEKNQLIFLMGRLKNRNSIDESKSLLKKYYIAAKKAYSETNVTAAEHDQYAFLLRTISVSLIVLGEKNVAEQYFSLLLTDKTANEVNRAFHLIYYGDKPYIPGRSRLDLSDEPEKGNQTFKVLCASVSNKLKLHKIDNMMMLELFTLCSLIQARIDCSGSKNPLSITDYGKKTAGFIEKIFTDRIFSRKIQEYGNLCLYFRWMQTELKKYIYENQKYSHADIYNAYNNACTVKRTGWVQRNIAEPENIVEHMYNCWLMAALYLPGKLDDNKEYSKQKIMSMLLIHDLGEYETGDIARPEKIKNQQYYDDRENEVMQGLFFSGTYPCAQNLSFLSEYWNDWFEKKDINYEIAKDIDNIQAVYRFCTYYLADSSLFDDDDAENWLSEIFNLKTNTGRDIAGKLILYNPEFADIIERFGLKNEYFE